MVSTKNPRVSYGLAILDAGERYNEIVVLTCDLMGSFQTAKFAETYPHRFFNLGVAEQNMAGIAAGLATCGKIPFANTFSCFASMRCLEMLRTDIAYPRLNVKIVACNAGISLGPGGTTHHSTVEFQGKWYLFYHDSSLSDGVTHKRSMKVSELIHNDDGTIQTIDP